MRRCQNELKKRTRYMHSYASHQKINKVAIVVCKHDASVTGPGMKVLEDVRKGVREKVGYRESPPAHLTILKIKE